MAQLELQMAEGSMIFEPESRHSFEAEPIAPLLKRDFNLKIQYKMKSVRMLRGIPSTAAAVGESIEWLISDGCDRP
jgi:hypothetical protein